MQVIEADYIVIGAGVAGLSCALEASKTGEVILISKDKVPAGNTYLAQGGIAAAVDDRDNPGLHLQDTLEAGAGECDRRAVKVLVEEGKQLVEQLMLSGFPYDREKDGSPRFGCEGAHSMSRIISASGDATGRALGYTLLEKVKEKENVHIYEQVTVVDLLVEKDRCYGVLALEFFGEEPSIFLGRAVVLAAGGCGQVYACTTNAINCTGDGFALAYRAGIQLANMEFVQFHPTALNTDENPKFLISEAVRGKGAGLINSDGYRFMPRYHSHAELAPRDVVARAIFAEQVAGKSVYLDVSPLGQKFQEYFPGIYSACSKRGIELPEDPVPVVPAAHFMMGGVKTGLSGETSLKGLYACGEVACTGVHGANRLASNSLLEGLVFGKRAGRAVSRESRRYTSRFSYCNAEGILKIFRGKKPGTFELKSDHKQQLLGELRELMWKEAGLVRTGQGLYRAVARIAEIECSLDENDITLKNMTVTAGVIARSALDRRENRGSHYRRDAVDFYNRQMLNTGTS